MMKLRVVSYNVLSSHLASPLHYTTLNPDHLDAQKRLSVVLNKLQNELQQQEQHNNNKPVVFCLQEVSHDWAGAFHTFFANQGYHLVTGLYGKNFNGYMGVALAWPTDVFQTMQVDISRLSDKRVGGWPMPDPSPSLLARLGQRVQQTIVLPWQWLGLVEAPEKPVDHWQVAEWRSNILLTATLRHKTSGQSFCIGNYHMPCAYYAPPVMTIHAEMAARHVRDLAVAAASSTTTTPLPYILAGDFNLKPTDATYRMLTTTEGLHPDDPCYPAPKNGYEWTVTDKTTPLRSAYAVCGGEPDFTNYARVREDEPFIDTLDYIFVSAEWQVLDVLPLPHRDAAKRPFPNLDESEPSDHVMIAADLECHNNA